MGVVPGPQFEEVRLGRAGCPVARILMLGAEDLNEVTPPRRQLEYRPAGLGVHVMESEYVSKQGRSRVEVPRSGAEETDPLHLHARILPRLPSRDIPEQWP